MIDDATDTTSNPASASRMQVWQKVLAAALVASAVLVVFSILSGLGAGSSAACSRCHALQAAALAASPHGSIGCGSCHFAARGPIVARLDVLTRMLPASRAGVQLEGVGRPVGSTPCIECHAKMVAGGILTKNGLTIDHTRCVVGSPCENCHSESIHGTSTRLVRRSAMADCIACHVAKKAPLTCATCHAQQASENGRSDPEWVRTHGPDWKAMHGTGDLRACAACHVVDFCRPCHHIDFPHSASFAAAHGAQVRDIGTDACLTCHKSQAYCDGCHGIQMPHPAGFLQRHSSSATSVSDPRCAVCNVIDDCVQCHTYHIHPGGTGLPASNAGGG